MKILQVVRHSNIISVFELIETEKHAFFMLELAENGDLLDYINTRRCLPEPEARHIFKQMAGAIAYCHSLNIVHRDLKCENIMLSKDMDVKIGGKVDTSQLVICAIVIIVGLTQNSYYFQLLPNSTVWHSFIIVISTLLSECDAAYLIYI